LLQAFLPYVFLPRVDVINERHAYLANAGLFVALGSLWQPLRERFGAASWLRGAPLVLALVLALLTHARTLDYQTELALWRSTVRVAPQNPRAQNNLGIAYEAAHHYQQACAAYARALQLEPHYAAAAKNLTRAAHLVPRPP
jgi:tetratricopeptide (TPR) repeat protein